MRNGDHMVFCAVLGNEKELFGGARLLRLGGHFPSSAVLHWSAGAAGRGVLCTGERSRCTCSVRRDCCSVLRVCLTECEAAQSVCPRLKLLAAVLKYILCSLHQPGKSSIKGDALHDGHAMIPAGNGSCRFIPATPRQCTPDHCIMSGIACAATLAAHAQNT